MSNRLGRLAVAVLLLSPAAVWAAEKVPAYVTKAVSDSHRPDADTKRDADRAPAPSLAFSGVKPGETVAELIPGGGYMTRLLSAVVGPKGHVYAINWKSMPTTRSICGRSARPSRGSSVIAVSATVAEGT